MGAGAAGAEGPKSISPRHLRTQISYHGTDKAFDRAPKGGYNTGMKETNSDFDPTLPTDRTPVTEWDQPMDEADSYVDWDELSNADADWRWESEQDDSYILEDSWDDESGLASAGFGMDESY